MKTAKIHFITGGQRSGKSVYAEQLALKASDYPTYLATSKIWDEDYKKRIEIHQNRRSANWTTQEEEVYISKVSSLSKVVLLDCITLWLTNIYDKENYNKEKTLAFAKQEWMALCSQDIQLFVVSNEIGMGVVPMDKGARGFADIQGEMNQFIAKMADEVTFIVSGLPLEIKRKPNA